MSDLDFRARGTRNRPLPPPSSAVSPGNWLIFAGAALAVMLLAIVIGSGPRDAGAPAAGAVGEVAEPFRPGN